MSVPLPVTVGIPTYARGERVLQPIERLMACVPPPAEIIVHVDCSDGDLEKKLAASHPQVRTISTSGRVGPGGGRHRCLHASSHEIFASFDDDSWPVEADYFARLMTHVQKSPETACFAAVITQKNEVMPPLVESCTATTDFTGCGYAVRASVYRSLPGFVDRPVAYGLEERDLALQLHAAGHAVTRCHDLRVHHDTEFSHHDAPEIVAATIQNAALLAWLRYPVSLWFHGLLQLANVVRFMLMKRRLKGVIDGLLGIPASCWKYRHSRKALRAGGIRSYFKSRKNLLASSKGQSA
jgi:GT2 family glycosyltransferase